MDKFKPFRLSPATRQIEEYMELLEEGQKAYYADLTELIRMECSPGGDGYRYVQSAIKRLEKRGIKYDNIPTEGYVRLTPGQAVGSVGNMNKNIGKKAVRTELILEALDVTRLNINEMHEYNANLICAKYTGRLMSKRSKTRLIKMSVSCQGQIDYDKIEGIYLRGKEAKT